MASFALPSRRNDLLTARRPALAAAILFACGIAMHEAMPAWPWLWLLLLVALLGGASAVRRSWAASICLVLGIGLAGLLAGQLAALYFRASAISLFTTDEPRLASIELELTDAPRLFVGEGPRHGSGRQVVRASAVRIKTWRGWEPATGETTLSFYSAEPRLWAGQRVRVMGMLQRPMPAMNPGEFDWERYYRRQRVLTSVRVTRACDLQVVEKPGIGSLLTRARQRVRDWLRAGFAPQREVDRELLLALVLGDRGPAMQKVEDACNATGASHLLASSGLRVGMLVACVYGLCRLLRIRPRSRLIAITLAVIGLGLTMNPSAQALRPVIACVALGAGLCLRRSIDSIQFLGLAALSLLICQPLELYSAGFQLTFIVVLGLLVMTSPIYTWIETRLRNPDVDVLLQIGRLSQRRRIWRWVWRKSLELAVAGMVAWFVSLPLVAYHFEQVNPWSVPIDLILLPVTLLALICGFLKIVLTALLPFGAPLWAACAGIPVAILRFGMMASAKIPGADIPVAPPPIWWIVLFYVLLVALCVVIRMPQARARVRRVARYGLGGAMGMCLGLPALVGFAGQSPLGGQVRITVLAVGAGQCVAVEPPDGRIILLDAGSSSLSDPLRTAIAPFLRSEGRSAVDELLLSHGDFDHINAAAGLITDYHLRQLEISPHFRRHATESATARHLLQSLDRTHHSPHLLTRGDHLDLGSDVKLDVLWPPPAGAMTSNNAGLVLRLTYAGKSILFPADIQEPAEAELLRDPAQLRADVLIAPHHGSTESTTAGFVRAVNPKLIISSDEHRLTSKQRKFEQLIGGRPLYRTGQCGAVVITIDKTGNIKAEPFLMRRATGWEQND